MYADNSQINIKVNIYMKYTIQKNSEHLLNLKKDGILFAPKAKVKNKLIPISKINIPNLSRGNILFSLDNIFCNNALFSVFNS